MDEWAKVEVMGHRVHWGRVSEVIQFGATMMRIDIFQGNDEQPIATKFYNGGSLYCVTPATEAVCREASSPKVYQTYALGAGRDDEEDDEFDGD